MIFYMRFFPLMFPAVVHYWQVLCRLLMMQKPPKELPALFLLSSLVLCGNWYDEC
ncbi:Uncharacterised protein [Actinobacillus equuli]|nr:Uncharacterised protein [Actinobacillus equuli]